MRAQQNVYKSQGRSQGAINGFILPKLPKLDFATVMQNYVANLVNANMWL